jgi:alpha,alpha-trehalase
MAYRLGSLAPVFPSAVVYCAANCADTKAGCDKSLLAVVQRLRIFKDSKHFVDLPLLPGRRPESVLEYWDAEFGRHVLEEELEPEDLGTATGGPSEMNRDIPTPAFRLARVEGTTTDFEEVRRFLLEHFDFAPGGDLLPWVPPDAPQLELPKNTLSEQPGRDGVFIDIWQWIKPRYPDGATWLVDMVSRWRNLGRQTSPLVYREPERFSLLPLRHPFVVAGGRFRECYYWDTYFIVRGLLVCGMWETARGCVDNLLDFVEQFGFVPNGARIYYLNRTQPPFLSDMVRCIVEEAPADWDVMEYLERALPLLEREYNFLMEQRGVQMRSGGMLNRYHAPTADGPRPESYYEDAQLAADCFVDLMGDPRRSELFVALTAAAESGWDFSSRWLRDRRNLCSIRTHLIVPVCLNSFLLRLERNLAYLYRWYHRGSRPPAAGAGAPATASGIDETPRDDEVVQRYWERAQQRAETVQRYLFVASRGQWIDYDLEAGASTIDTAMHQDQTVCASNFFPIWGGLLAHLETAEAANIALDALETFEKSGLLCVGGVAATLVSDSGQQWDYPNAWPPVQLLLYEAFSSIAAQFATNQELVSRARSLCARIGASFLRSVYLGWRQTGNLFEKYHAADMGISGHGGEYAPQMGFGWTIGVALTLLKHLWCEDQDALSAIWTTGHENDKALPKKSSE